MILSKANQVGSGVEVIGILTHDVEFDCMRIRVKKDKGSTIYSIVPSTLKHSFNNGESWHTENEIKEALEFKEEWRKSMGLAGGEAKSKSCENCDRWTPYLTKGNFGECFINKETWGIDEYCSKHEPK